MADSFPGCNEQLNAHRAILLQVLQIGQCFKLRNSTEVKRILFVSTLASAIS